MNNRIVQLFRCPRLFSRATPDIGKPCQEKTKLRPRAWSPVPRYSTINATLFAHATLRAMNVVHLVIEEIVVFWDGELQLARHLRPRHGGHKPDHNNE